MNTQDSTPPLTPLGSSGAAPDAPLQPMTANPTIGEVVDADSKPEQETAWLDGNGRVWVESGISGRRRMHLAGWSQGIDLIDPADGTDIRDKMTPLIAPLAPPDDLTDDLIAELLHTATVDAAIQLGFQEEHHAETWADLTEEAREHARRVAAHVHTVLRAQFTHEHGVALQTARETAERERMKNIAIEMAAGGHWGGGLEEVIGNREHSYWSPALDIVADLSARPAAAVAGRPDGSLPNSGDHYWTVMRPGYFVCLACPLDGSYAEWPCPAAREAHPSLRHYNDMLPVNSPVLFRPNGVGDPTPSHTRTPVWLGKDDQPYVSVTSYPPQAGAAVKLGDLLGVDGQPLPRALPDLGAVEVLDRYGM